MDKIRELCKFAHVTLESTKAPQKEKQNADKKEKSEKPAPQSNKQDPNKFENYFNFTIPVKYAKPHQVLAINRGESLKILAVKVTIPEEVKRRFTQYCSHKWVRADASDYLKQITRDSIDDAYKRLIQPLMIRHFRSELTRQAEKASVDVFAANLKSLLLTPPVRGRVVMGMDPGFRNGCKYCIVAPNGQVLDQGVAHLHTKSAFMTKEVNSLAEKMKKYRCSTHKMVMENTRICVGSRIESDGHKATVRFIGEVPPTKGAWFGVEWDDPQRGKHDGSHEGRRYFETKFPTSGSFIRPKKANSGVSFIDAVHDRYGRIEDKAAGVLTEEMFVLGKNKVTTVEVVGAEKVNKKQSDFQHTLELGVGDKSISSPGNPATIQSYFPSVTQLDLASNLFNSWKDISIICKALKALETLDVSRNRLELPDVPSDFQVAFQNVTALFINKMNYTWKEVLIVFEMIVKLEEVHMCLNTISDIDSLSPNMKNLKILNLESNPIREWKHVLVLGELPNLEHLLLNDCGLEQIEFPDVPLGKKTSYFPQLNQLALFHNKINSWHPINELNKLQSLSHLKIKHNPITQPTDSCSEELIRYIIIAKIGSLTVLNRSVIDKGERDGSEIDYRKIFGTKWKESGGHQDPAQNKPSEDFLREHPRYMDLIAKYGAPEDSELKVQSSALKNTLLNLNIECSSDIGKKPVSKKVPDSMTVQKLRILVQKLFRLNRQDVHLSYRSQKAPDQEFPLEFELKDIGYYAIEDGDTIFVK